MMTLSRLCLSFQEAINFVRDSVKEVITSTDGNLTRSLLVLMECLYQPFIPIKVDFAASITVTCVCNS